MGPRLGRVEYVDFTVRIVGHVQSFNGATLRTRGIPDDVEAGKIKYDSLQWGHA